MERAKLVMKSKRRKKMMQEDVGLIFMAVFIVLGLVIRRSMKLEDKTVAYLICAMLEPKLQSIEFGRKEGKGG